MQVPVTGELHQPHRGAGAVGAVLAQEDNSIEHAVPLIEDMAHLETGVIGVATEPPQTSLTELIKPRKAQVAAIKEQQPPSLQPREHVAGMLLAVRARLAQQ